MTNLETGIEYANKIISKEISACVEIQQACKLFLSDIQNDLYYFNHKEVNKKVKFCHSFVSPTSKKKIVLMPWQVFLICAVFGIYQKSINKRKYRTFFLLIPRGNGKTFFTLMLAMEDFIFTPVAQVVIGANTNRQTTEVDLEMAKLLAEQIDPSKKVIKNRYNKLIYGNNRLLAISNQADNFEGTAVSFGCVDEFHEFKTLNLYNSIRTSLAKREDSLLFITSTSGTDVDTECYKMVQYSKKVLKGEIKDDSIFPLLYGIDAEDKLDTEAEISLAIYKANPSAQLLRIDVLKSEILKTKYLDDSEKITTLSRHLNIWTRAGDIDAYLSQKLIDRATVDISLDSPEFRGCEVIVGADLSINDDISAICFLVIKDDIYYFFHQYYICSGGLATQRNNERYSEACANGYIRILEGEAIDYNIIINDLKARNTVNPIKLIAFDKFNAKNFTKQLDNEGFNLCRISQLASGLNDAVKELQRLFLLDKVRLQRNDISTWMFSNAIVDSSKYDLWRLVKKDSGASKIDGLSAAVDCVAGLLIAPEYGFNVW